MYLFGIVWLCLLVAHYPSEMYRYEFGDFRSPGTDTHNLCLHISPVFMQQIAVQCSILDQNPPSLSHQERSNTSLNQIAVPSLVKCSQAASGAHLNQSLSLSSVSVPSSTSLSSSPSSSSLSDSFPTLILTHSLKSASIHRLLFGR